MQNDRRRYPARKRRDSPRRDDCWQRQRRNQTEVNPRKRDALFPQGRNDTQIVVLKYVPEVA